MIIFMNSKSTKFCQIILRIKRFIHKRKVIPFLCLMVYLRDSHSTMAKVMPSAVCASTNSRMHTKAIDHILDLSWL